MGILRAKDTVSDVSSPTQSSPVQSSPVRSSPAQPSPACAVQIQQSHSHRQKKAKCGKEVVIAKGRGGEWNYGESWGSQWQHFCAFLLPLPITNYQLQKKHRPPRFTSRRSLSLFPPPPVHFHFCRALSLSFSPFPR